ncbi:hypothetical protein PSUB009319_16420 [Ralstonia sp. SET104]|nr:hypothetical protein PSUB009319_16420 [Ralstonia sp. SET104]
MGCFRLKVTSEEPEQDPGQAMESEYARAAGVVIGAAGRASQANQKLAPALANNPDGGRVMAAMIADYSLVTPSNQTEHNVVFEMAHIEILAGKQGEFEAAVQQALPLFARAKGCHGAELHHIVERDTSYVLLVRWNTVQDHMVSFRESDDFQEWRKLVGPFFAKAPEVVHSEVAVK